LTTKITKKYKIHLNIISNRLIYFMIKIVFSKKILLVFGRIIGKHLLEHFLLLVKEFFKAHL